VQPACSNVRNLCLLLVIACGEKSQTGSVTPAPVVDAARGSSSPGVALPSSGKPPQKTTRPLDKAALAKLAALEVAGHARTVRKLDEGFLDLELVLAKPPIRVSVAIQPCLRCLPMQVDRWRAESDTLRVVIPPDLRDRADTTFEVASTTIGGAPAIWTYQLAWVADKDSAPIHDHAVTLYFNDGVNQIRAIAAFAGVRAATMVGPWPGVIWKAPPRRSSIATRRRGATDYFATAILRGFASAFLPIVSVSTPASSLAAIFSPSASSGSEKLRVNDPNCRS
jgi:hypothetical protein